MVGIPILLGRDFADTDTANAPRVTVINESMAKFYFGKRNPLGATVFYDSRLKFTLTVIGVAKDVRDHLVRDQPPRRFYVSYMQPVDGQMGTDYEIRSALSTAVLDRQVRQGVRSVSPRLSIEFLQPLEKSIDDSMIRERLIARLSILFGLLSLLLGCAGLYGIMAYSVARRTQEIGIRIAIGGQPHNVVWTVVAETLLLVAAGLAAAHTDRPLAEPLSAVAAFWFEARRRLVDILRRRDHWVHGARRISLSRRVALRESIR